MKSIAPITLTSVFAVATLVARSERRIYFLPAVDGNVNTVEPIPTAVPWNSPDNPVLKSPDPPPPPEILISTVVPFMANVLPAPMKFSVVGLPIDNPPDDIPIVESPHAGAAAPPADLITCPVVP